ncbi:MAG TPA: peptidoglycan recognition family protein, partial [Sedimentisphaerales bacterium]|nr:peptidoglycan recognition family protein [Armatimonadota bacterium]HUV65231.1 peptidoglycan recognition family protein [Sedimentisphaerales bacterium]
MRFMRLCAIASVLALASVIGFAAPPGDGAHTDLETLANDHGGKWNEPLMPLFEKAAKNHDVPLPLLLTLGYFGSAFENRGDIPTIELGYGVMALRENSLGGNSLADGAMLTGEPKEKLKVNPWANINTAAAILSAYANQMGVDRSKGLEAWVEPVIKYAGLDEENSRYFAMEVFEKLLTGLDWKNSSGESFGFPPQEIGAVDLSDLLPPDMRNTRQYEPTPSDLSPEAIAKTAETQINPTSAQYPPAIWDPAASCNYTATSTSKNTVVIHTIEGTAAGCRAWFKNCDSQVSAHYVTSEAGGVWQCVDEWYKAWHVGCANSYCIGIENEGYASSPSHPAS